MRRCSTFSLFILLATISGLLLFRPGFASAQGVTWNDITFDEALVQASQENRRLFVYVFTPWCGNCEQIESQAFTTPEVAALTADLLTIQVDGDTEEGEVVTERYGTTGFPTVLILAPDGEEVDRILGFAYLDLFTDSLQELLNGGGIYDLRAQLETEPDNVEVMLALGLRYAERGEINQTKGMLLQIIEADFDNSRGFRTQAHLALGQCYLQDARERDAAIEEFNILIDQFPDAPETDGARLELFEINARGGDQQLAMELAEVVISHTPDTSSVYNQIAWALFEESFELQRGLEIALMGVAVDATDHYLWDTVAELQFALGDVEGAVASIQHSVELAPEESYYQQQYQRFSSHLESTRPQ